MDHKRSRIVLDRILQQQKFQIWLQKCNAFRFEQGSLSIDATSESYKKHQRGILLTFFVGDAFMS